MTLSLNIYFMFDWYLLSLVTMLVFVIYFVLIGNVGFARNKFKISAPAMTGNADFERYVRVHYNTMEQMVMMLPSMWFFAYFVNIQWASILGGLWCLGRIVYAIGYYRGANQRHLGSMLSFVPTIIFLIGTIISLVMKLTA